MDIRSKRLQAGFTLIELLVVVLIIGILASIAIPQYFKVVERARVSEAHAFISQLKQAQERYLARAGSYIVAEGELGKLDVSLPGSSPDFGMKNFSAKVETSDCGGDPGYKITMTRVGDVASRYTSGYTAVYDRCTGLITYDGCANCTTDFAQ